METNSLKIRGLLYSFIAGFALLWTYFFLIKSVDFPDIPFRFFIYGALTEEALKFATVLFLLYGIRVYPIAVVAVGAGFGFAEGLSHLTYEFGSVGMIAFGMHTVVGIVAGILAATAFSKKFLWLWALALFVPIFLHWFYNDHLIYWIVALLP